MAESVRDLYKKPDFWPLPAGADAGEAVFMVRLFSDGIGGAGLLLVDATAAAYIEFTDLLRLARMALLNSDLNSKSKRSSGKQHMTRIQKESTLWGLHPLGSMLQWHCFPSSLPFQYSLA